jgi:hypothetical protein
MGLVGNPVNRGKGQQFSALDSFNKTVEASSVFSK